MRRYLGLFRIQAKAALLLSMQYRLDFFLRMFMAVFWTFVALMPLIVLFSMRDGVAGFTAAEAMIVAGFFMTLKGLLIGVIQPSLTTVVEHIRKGTLDFLLLKPVDAQFLLSTSSIELSHVSDVLAGLGVVIYGLHGAGVLPAPIDVTLTLLMLSCAVLILYAIWIMVVSLSFYVVKIDNLSHLIVSTFDAARWPSSLFRGALSFLFTFVIPLALMTTYPTLALLGRISVAHVLTAVGVAAVFLLVSRSIWMRALRAYTSAGG
jgi:ABC-2 type transport system permease protein